MDLLFKHVPFRSDGHSLFILKKFQEKIDLENFFENLFAKGVFFGLGKNCKGCGGGPCLPIEERKFFMQFDFV